MDRTQQKIKSIREKLVSEGDVSFEDSLFVWKVFTFEKAFSEGNRHAGIHGELLEWYKTVLKLLEGGRKGTFTESLPLSAYVGTTADLKDIIRRSLSCLDEEEKRRELSLNISACSYIAKHVSPLSVFDIIAYRPSLVDNTMKIEFLRCGAGKRILSAELYARPRDKQFSTIEIIRDGLINRADFPAIFGEGCVATFKGYEEKLNKVLNTTEDDVISADPDTRKLFNERWRSENTIKYFNILNNVVLRMAGDSGTDFDPDMTDNLIEAQRIRRAIQKEDISPEEADEIFLDIFVADSFDSNFNNYLPNAVRLFEDWIKFVYKRARRSEEGNFLTSVPIITKRHFNEITMKIRDRLPEKYTVNKAYLFNTDVVPDPEIGVIVHSANCGIRISSSRLGKIKEVLKNLKVKSAGINVNSGVREWISDTQKRFMDYNCEPDENAFTLAKTEILVTGGVPVVVLSSPKGNPWWATKDLLLTEHSQEVKDLIDMTAEEAFEGLPRERLPFRDILKAVKRNYEIKRSKEVLLAEDDWVIDR